MTTLPYIIEVQIAFALLWLVYRIAMHRGGRLTVNRAYLLGMAVSALLIPVLTIRVWPAPETIAIFSLDTLETSPIAATPPPATLDIRWIYLAGVAVLLAVSAAQLLRLGHIIRTAQKKISVNGYACLETPRIGRAATFLNYILVNPASLDEGQLRQVVAHERAHVALGHSYDLLFAQGVAIALWWNPFVWLWKRSLREVHEYQADTSVLGDGFDAGNYATLILQSLTGIRPGFASGFSYQLLKNRLVMIQNSRRGSAARILFALPVVAGLLATFSCAARKPQAITETQTVAIIANSVQIPQTTPVGTPLERPVRTLEVDTEGSPIRVKVRDERPSATTIEIDIRGTDTIVHINGERVPMEMLDLKTLRGDTTIKYARFTQQRRQVVAIDGEPLLIVDGTEVPRSLLNAIDADKIQSIDVLKDAASIAKYGERGKNGVILLTLKPATDKPAPDDVFFKVEQMPAFEGGDLNTFRMWVQNNLRYPTSAVEAKEQGRVVTQFIIEKDGSVSNVTVVNSPGQSLSDEVVRVIKLSPKWTPGKQQGQTVRVKYTLPADFRIPEDKK